MAYWPCYWSQCNWVKPSGCSHFVSEHMVVMSVFQSTIWKVVMHNSDITIPLWKHRVISTNFSIQLSHQLTCSFNLLCSFLWPAHIQNVLLLIYLGFSYFKFKIRLIKVGLSFQKQNILYLNSQLADSQSGVITITPKSQLWVGYTEKPSLTFSHAWVILVEFT